MAVRVTILNASFVSERKDKVQTTFPHLRLGVANIASFIKKHGADVSVIDPQAEKINIDQLVSKIMSLRPDYLCLPAYTEEINDAGLIAKRIKQLAPNTIVIIGGYHVSALPHDTLENFCFDIGIVGEGERALGDIINKIPLKEIDGIVYKNADGKSVLNKSHRKPLSLDDLPFPAWDLYDLSLYEKSLPIEPLRGCPFTCVFCFRALGRKVTYKSPERFVNELRYYQKNSGVNSFRFLAGTFPLERKHAIGICRKIIADGLNITWTASTRVDTVDYELLDLMKKSGCRLLQFGVESGDPDMLNSVAKGITPELCIKALGLCHKVGIKAGLNFIIGLPNETKASIKTTYRLAVKLRKYACSANFAILVPFPGTKVYQMALQNEGCLSLRTKDWSDFGKQAGFALRHSNFKEFELQRLQSLLYLRYYIGSPIKTLKKFSFRKAAVVVKRAISNKA